MSDAINHSIVGSDGHVPSYDPDAKWHMWGLHEIYKGMEGKGKYIPKVLDNVKDPTTNMIYYVKSLDQLTLIPELVAIGSENSLGLNSNDLLFATGPGWPSQNYRIYYDNKVFPYRLSIHTFCQIRSVDAAYAKVVRGSFLGVHEVISEVYDPAGNFHSDKVELETVALEPGWVNYSIKVVKRFNTSKALQNGETLTVLIYSRDGNLLSHTPLVVTMSDTTQDLNVSSAYITQIGIKSPFRSDYDPTLLSFPLNWNKGSMNMMGTVTYSDGSTIEMPIDGRKFELLGLDQMLSSIAGAPVDMTLVYNLGPDEVTHVESLSHNNKITLPIRVQTTNINNSYTVKLFACPYWDTGIDGFRLRWWLLNLERNIYREVTTHVKFAANSAAFDPNGLGIVQRLQVSLNLRDIFPTYKPFVHTQIVEVTLYGHPNDYPTPWIVKHQLTDSIPFGGALNIQMVDNYNITLKNNFEKDEWIRNFYMNMRPLSETPEVEDSVPVPTHFTLIVNGLEAEFPIDDFDKTLSLASPVRRFDTIHILFTRKVAGGTFYLGIGSLCVQQ